MSIPTNEVRDQSQRGSTVKGHRFAIVPEWVLDHPDLTDRAVRMYAVLVRYAGDDTKAYPGCRALADRLRCSVRSVRYTLDELVAVGAIVVEPHYRDDGSQSSNTYWLWPMRPDESVQQAATPPATACSPPPATGCSPKKESQLGSEKTRARVKTSNATATGPDRFDEFYKVYPVHKELIAAKKAWEKAMKGGVDAQLIIDRARAYRDDPGRNYTKNPATWLNKGCWDDELVDAQPVLNGFGGTYEVV